MEDIPFMALLQQPVEKMEGTSSSGASAGQTSDMDSGDGTVEMDPTSRSTASSNKSTASPKSAGSPIPGSQPGSMPDDYVMVELVSFNASLYIFYFYFVSLFVLTITPIHIRKRNTYFRIF